MRLPRIGLKLWPGRIDDPSGQPWPRPALVASPSPVHLHWSILTGLPTSPIFDKS